MPVITLNYTIIMTVNETKICKSLSQSSLACMNSTAVSEILSRLQGCGGNFNLIRATPISLAIIGRKLPSLC